MNEPDVSMTWRAWLDQHVEAGLLSDLLPPGTPETQKILEQAWTPNPDDRKAAWELYTELRTRITVQPLHYLHGDEVTALESVAALFATSREVIRKSGPQARHFATITVFVLNRVVRPFTAEWHKRKSAGELNNEDTRHEFRTALERLQPKLRSFATVLGALAEGSQFCRGSESWPAAGAADPADEAPPVVGGFIPFDIAFDDSVDAVVAAKIRWDEHNAIRLRRDLPQLPLPEGPPNPTPEQIAEQHRLPATGNDRLNDVAGLAISGGGIRSATFALGVVQRLAAAGVLSRFDYTSTVSGGGYLGSFLSTYLNTDDADPADGKPAEVGLSNNQLPFRKPPVGESGALRHLRGHSKYLISGGLLNRLNMVLLAVHGVLANIVIFWPLLAGALLAVAAYQGKVIHDLVNQKTFSLGNYMWHAGGQQVALLAIAVALITLAPASLLLRRLRLESLLTRYQTLVSFVLIGGLVVTVWNLIPPVFRQFDFVMKSDWKRWFANSTIVSGAVVLVQRFWANLDSAPAASKMKQVVVMMIMGLVAPMFAAALFLWLGYELIVKQPVIWDGRLDSVLLLALLTFIPLLFGLLVLDINQSSLHPFYRRKLSEAYLIAHAPGHSGNVDQIRSGDGLRLSELRSRNPHAPYHLINTALNAPSSKNDAIRGRGTDFFLFSQLYVGSAATGYYETRQWEKLDSHVNLGTAMAISAGAASPYMGMVTVPSASLLLTMLNIRLDYWLAVPNRKRVPLLTWHPGPWYLLRQAFGWMDEKSTFVNVSDGGHIENLAIYELLRRRCRFIVAIDGECDPNLSCGSLMQLTRFALIDFGVQIKIDLSRFRRTDDGNAPFHFTLGEIHYPRLNDGSPAAVGQILYVKLSCTGNEPPHVKHYRLRNSNFPHQSTADQFFDEEQFEAYRALGEHAAGDLFSQELLGDAVQPKSLADWFGRIGRALHDPRNS
jgi:hypothetical protein